MKIVVAIVLSCILPILSKAHVLYTHNFPYTTYSPYAFGYSYLTAPYFRPYTYRFVSVKDLPDHKGDSPVSDKQTLLPIISTTSSSSVEDTKKEDIEKLSTLSSSEQMPQTTADLKFYKFSYPVVYTIPTPLEWQTSSQFHHQDELGQYHYGYANSLSAKQEVKTLDGITRGSYSYIDGNHELQTVDYISDAGGFRVAATNLPKLPEPVAIPDSHEIQQAKLEHFKIHAEALQLLKEANLADAKPAEGNANSNEKLDTK